MIKKQIARIHLDISASTFNLEPRVNPDRSDSSSGQAPDKTFLRRKSAASPPQDDKITTTLI
jgi:hypothetical protein